MDVNDGWGRAGNIFTFSPWVRFSRKKYLVGKIKIVHERCFMAAFTTFCNLTINP